jgi:hypothetical protein
MSTNQDEPTMASLLTRVSELEQEMAALRAARGAKSSQEVSQPRLVTAEETGDAPVVGRANRKRSSRRGLLRTAVVAGATVVGAGALLDRSDGVAHADGTETPTTFISHGSPRYAIQAISTNGALGVLVSSDSNAGVLASSDSAAGVVAHSTSNAGIVASSDSAPGVLGISFSDAGVFGTSMSNAGVGGESSSNYGVHAVGGGASRSAGPGAAGVFAEGGPNFGVFAQSTSGTGLYATSSSGPALVANGHVQVQGNAVGSTTLLAGHTSVTVTTSAATTSSNVLLTPLANPKAHLWVTRAAGSFTIHASAARSTNLAIVYLIIN